MVKRPDDQSIIDLWLESRGYGRSSRVITHAAFRSYGDNPVWLAWMESRFQQLALTSAEEYRELVALGVNTASVYEAAWRCQFEANERWYKPYLFDHEDRRIPGYRGRRVETLELPA